MGTPGARRHTSVKASDVQEALNLATPALPILVEEEEEIMETEPVSTPTSKRGSKRKSREVIDVEMEEVSLNKGKKKAKTDEEAPRKMTR